MVLRHWFIPSTGPIDAIFTSRLVLSFAFLARSFGLPRRYNYFILTSRSGPLRYPSTVLDDIFIIPVELCGSRL